MNIRDNREITNFAVRRLDDAPSYRRIVLLYAALTLGMSALVTVANFILGAQMDNYGGLGNMGTRRVLSSIQTLLPMVQSVLALCLEVGYLAAMLRIARGQFVSPKTLRLGLDRFWVLLRCDIIKSLILMGSAFLGAYLGIMLFLVTPLSRPALELLAPYLEELTVLDSTLVLEEAVYLEFSRTLLPAYAICAVTIGGLTVPVLYSYRMVYYVIIDRPAMGALAALRESKKMMRRNRLALFRLDLRLWWYYAALLGATALGYCDVILPLLGVELPWSGDVSYFLFYGLYLVALFGVTYFLRNRVEVAYGMAYDAVKPSQAQNSGVVLGNIFDMQ